MGMIFRDEREVAISVTLNLKVHHALLGGRRGQTRRGSTYVDDNF